MRSSASAKNRSTNGKHRRLPRPTRSIPPSLPFSPKRPQRTAAMRRRKRAISPGARSSIRSMCWRSKIDERYAEDKRAREREELQDVIAADNARLASGLRTLDTDFRAHRIGADQRYALE